MGTDSDFFTHSLRTVLDTLTDAAEMKNRGVETAKHVAHEATHEDGWLRRSLRCRLKFTGLHPRRKRMLERVQARTLIDAYDGRDVIRACEACRRAGIEEWRVRAVFEEMCDNERRLQRFA